MGATPSPSPLGLAPSFGFGDRLGLATPGHLAALKKHGKGIAGIFAQQSIREMTRTNRNPDQVMTAATEALSAASFSAPWGADADHLKTHADVDLTLKAGFTFFTIDPSAHVDDQADDYTDGQLKEKFAEVREFCPWVDQYLNKTVQVTDGPSITFDEETVWRAAVKYGRAIAHTLDMGKYIQTQAEAAGQGSEIELSVDETPQPTTLAEHYIFAQQIVEAGVNLVSLAPRYYGEFEKGIDFKGDLDTFEITLADHAAIAQHIGPYKLSLHSGSDKLSIYASFARLTHGMFHVKTAGTSYLEALRVLVRHDPALFRKIVEFSRARFDTDKATYHISATLQAVAPPSALPERDQLEMVYLNQNDGRQILHVTFGSVLTHAEFGPAMQEVLVAHPESHAQILADHFGKHLKALREGM